MIVAVHFEDSHSHAERGNKKKSGAWGQDKRIFLLTAAPCEPLRMIKGWRNR